jgi:hypothetical protein
MLVRLYDLPDSTAGVPPGVVVRRALPAEKHHVITWVSQTFGRGWANECETAFCRQPVSCFVAVEENRPVGFCVYDATARGVAGPIGVASDSRHRGVGRVLLLATLTDMRANGYAYGAIGWVASAEFFRRVCDAREIEGSEPGLYRGLMKDSGRI